MKSQLIVMPTMRGLIHNIQTDATCPRANVCNYQNHIPGITRCTKFIRNFELWSQTNSLCNTGSVDRKRSGHPVEPIEYSNHACSPLAVEKKLKKPVCSMYFRCINTLTPWQNDHQFAENILKFSCTKLLYFDSHFSIFADFYSWGSAYK